MDGRARVAGSRRSWSRARPRGPGVARDRRLHGSAATRSSRARSSALTAATCGRRAARGRAHCVLARRPPSAAPRGGARDGVVRRARSVCSSTRTATASSGATCWWRPPCRTPCRRFGRRLRRRRRRGRGRERFGDPDLVALALMDQGRHLVRLGRVREGLEQARRGDGRGDRRSSCRRSSPGSSTAA